MNMGVKEAVMVYDALRNYGALTSENIRQNVLPLVYAGPDLVDGTEEFFNFYRDMHLNLSRNREMGQEISPEAAHYIHDILDYASGGKTSVLTMHLEECPDEVYEEVRSILGDTGMKYLGISQNAWDIRPHRHRLFWQLEEEESARERAFLNQLDSGDSFTSPIYNEFGQEDELQ